MSKHFLLWLFLFHKVTKEKPTPKHDSITYFKASEFVIDLNFSKWKFSFLSSFDSNTIEIKNTSYDKIGRAVRSGSHGKSVYLTRVRF
jgi:hypothetical protein